MAQIQPYIKLRYGVINEPIRVPISPLLVDKTQTFLTVDTVVGTSVVIVKNSVGFGSAQIVLIGEPGNEGSEIIKTGTTFATTTISLSANTSFPHSSGTYVYVLKFDQIELTSSANTTPTGTTLIQLVNIVADDKETTWNDTTTTSGYYFARYKNSITGVFSPLSSPAPIGGYTIMSARSVIDNALGMINKNTSEVLSDEFAFREINNCQMETLREFKRWSFMQKFDSIIGQASTGTWKIAVPTDLDDQNTTKSIYNFRIGKELELDWVDKEDWNDIVSGQAYSTTASQSGVGSATIVLTSSNDFDASGSIQAGSTTIAYTANDKTTGILTTSAITGTVTINQDVFQATSLGNPSYYTVFGGYIWHWPVTSSSYNGRNYYLDYYKKLTTINRDSDEIVLPDPTIAQYYLAWKFLLKLSNGEPSPASEGMFGNYVARRELAKRKESLNRNFEFYPEVPYI